MASSADDFFGVNMIGFDPYHQSRLQTLDRYQRLDSLLNPQGQETQGRGMSPAQVAEYRTQNPIQADGQQRAHTQNQFMSPWAQMAMQMGGGWNSGQEMFARMAPEQPEIDNGGGGTGGGGEGGGTAPPDGVPPEENGWCKPGFYLNGNDGKCYPNTTPDLPPIDTGTGTGNTGGYTGGGGYTSSYPSYTPSSSGPQIPADLIPLRQQLGAWLTSNMGQLNPMYPGVLDVYPSPSHQVAHNLAAGQTLNIQDALRNQFGPAWGGLMQTNVQANFGPLQNALASMLGGGAYQNQMANLAQSGMGDVGNWLNRAGGAYQTAEQSIFPWQANNLNQRSAAADAALESAGQGLWSLGNQPAINQGQIAYMDPAMQQAARNMAYSGNMGDPTAAMQAIAAQTRGQMEDVGASIREQYGAMGLGSGTDVSEAVARGLGRELANMNTAQQQLWLGNFNQAQDRALQGQALLPSYAQALNAPGIQQQATRLAANQGLLGLGGAQGNLLSQVGGQLLGNAGLMANVGQGYGQLGAINSAATGQIGNLWGNAANLSNSAVGTGLSSGYQQLMANPALALQSAGIRADALGQWAPAMSLWNQAQLGGANTLTQLGAYDMALQEGNVNRAWQNWQLGQQPRFLDQAIAYATGFPPALQKPIVQNQSGVSAMGGLLGGIGSLIGSLGFISDRTLKTGFREVDLQDVLRGVEELNIEEWEYIFEPRTKHIGPMAQDWKRTFGVGSGVTIDAVDAVGVLLASVKALAQRVRELEAKNAEAR